MSGKVLSALLTVIALLWAVRLLPVAEYATYVTMFATVELCLVVGSFGLPWMASRYIPEFNLRATRAQLRRLCERLLAAQGLALAAVAIVLVSVLVAVPALPSFPVNPLAVAAMAALLVVEGTGRFVRDSQLAPLMMQRASRLSLVLRQFLLVAGIAVLAGLALHTAVALLLIECVAATASTMVALASLRLRLRRSDEPAFNGAQAPLNATEGLRNYGVALRMYAAHLLSLTYSPVVLLHLVQRNAGVEAAALFGFLRLVFDQIARYLPAMLLFSLIRPKLMAGYVSGGFAELNRNALLFGKLSLFVLCPLIAAVAVGGDALVRLISSQRFPDAGHVLLGFVFALVPLSQRQLFESVAVAADLSRLCLVASVVSAVTLPILLMLWPGPFGVAAAIAAMVAGHAIFDFVLAGTLRFRAGFRGDPVGWGKLVAASLLAYASGATIGAGLVRAGIAWWPWIGSASVIPAFLAVAWLLKPFSAEERARINGLVRRRVFIW